METNYEAQRIHLNHWRLANVVPSVLDTKITYYRKEDICKQLVRQELDSIHLVSTNQKNYRK